MHLGGCRSEHGRRPAGATRHAASISYWLCWKEKVAPSTLFFVGLMDTNKSCCSAAPGRGEVWVAACAVMCFAQNGSIRGLSKWLHNHGEESDRRCQPQNLSWSTGSSGSFVRQYKLPPP
jgi:hypothetical protein